MNSDRGTGSKLSPPPWKMLSNEHRSAASSPSPLPYLQPVSGRRQLRYHGVSRMSDYTTIEQLGKGTFGVVMKAKQNKTDKLVAIKKLIIHDTKNGFPVTAFREITIMKKFKHLNNLQLLDLIFEPSSDTTKPGIFYTVTPYISSDLNGLLNNPNVKLAVPHIKCIMSQVLEGINYVHQQNYLHRDIKTANILLDYFGVVKIADFGLARIYHGRPPISAEMGPGGGKYEYTGLVVTRWYRPPELLLGERKYTTSVDMWGIGCVLGEMYKKRPILEGSSDLDQANIIFKLVGSPNEETMPGYRNLNGNGVNLTVKYDGNIDTEFSKLGRNGCELLKNLLALNPYKRLNALAALNHPYFTTEPLPCKPSELPKFEESHESDVKRYKESAATIGNGTFKKSVPGDYDNGGSLGHSKYGNSEQMHHSHSNGYISSMTNSINHISFSNDKSSLNNRNNSSSNNNGTGNSKSALPDRPKRFVGGSSDSHTSSNSSNASGNIIMNQISTLKMSSGGSRYPDLKPNDRPSKIYEDPSNFFYSANSGNSSSGRKHDPYYSNQRPPRSQQQQHYDNFAPQHHYGRSNQYPHQPNQYSTKQTRSGSNSYNDQDQKRQKMGNDFGPGGFPEEAVYGGDNDNEVGYGKDLYKDEESDKVFGAINKILHKNKK
ncbi:unnamed protein product [[Candida] boidinii]|uniref:Serine/threonine-protein kinase BUR1 n=1 Tax=Candida boidinii TaxID=5477 RepID=A0A9W6SZA5_CANBO|nr:nucleotide binding protein [[Candida] boidinii]GME71167.1 unnamed protein product [[Candida] boidinii]GMF99210.1 unnamed protein product [[Candida] boidinii]